ncbi:hypothetical protein [Kitasatospora sp. NPDC059571]|uniref:hypothetical protein n=1 Tax=Kitasatospora sp. NPDC059571 TaxID=3346871 RepID=UPI0036C9F72A
MMHSMRAEYGPGGPDGGVKTWHIVRGEEAVALCGRELDAGAPGQDPSMWDRTPRLNCHTCGAMFLRESPYVPGEHE